MAIITLADYKSFAGINSPTNDTQHQFLVDFSNEYIENFCNTKFEPIVVLEHKTTSNNGLEIILPNAPVLSVEELRFATEIVDPLLYILHPGEGIIEAIISFPSDRFAFEVDFTWGHTVPPADVIYSALEYVTYLDKREFNMSRNLGNGESATYTSSAIIPAHIRNALSVHRVL
jgi:hypothetical protein